MIKTMLDNIQSIYYTPVTESKYKWYPELPAYTEWWFIFRENVPKIEAGWDTKEDSRLKEYRWEDGRHTTEQILECGTLFLDDDVLYEKASVTVVWSEGGKRCKRTTRYLTNKEAEDYCAEVETEVGRKMIIIK